MCSYYYLSTSTSKYVPYLAQVWEQLATTPDTIRLDPVDSDCIKSIGSSHMIITTDESSEDLLTRKKMFIETPSLVYSGHQTKEGPVRKDSLTSRVAMDTSEERGGPG